MEVYGLMFIVIKENQPLHELDEPTCDIKYLSQEMKGIIIKQYYTGFVERTSEVVNDENQQKISLDTENHLGYTVSNGWDSVAFLLGEKWAKRFHQENV